MSPFFRLVLLRLFKLYVLFLGNLREHIATFLRLSFHVAMADQ